MSPKLSQFFQHKVVFITGAGSGIGRALALRLADVNAHLFLTDIDCDRLSETTQLTSSRQGDGKTFTHTFDVADLTEWQDALAIANKHFGHIDILINNAGIEGSGKPAWATSAAQIQRVMAVNFWGMVHGSQSALPYLIDRPWAALVNVSSIFGLVGVPNCTDYCASKFAIRGYTEALRAELMQVHPHVQVQLVHPGGIQTNITRQQHTQAFKHKYLVTSPQSLAVQVLTGIVRNNPRIVFGHRARLTHWASRLLPLGLLNLITVKEMKTLALDEDYTPTHSGFAMPAQPVNKDRSPS